jgi:hypothetical protein
VPRASAVEPGCGLRLPVGTQAADHLALAAPRLPVSFKLQ